MVPVEGEIRLDRAARLRVREEVIRGRADTGADVPGTGSLNRKVFGVDMFIGPDPHAHNLSLELEPRRVLGSARAHPVLQPKRVACFKRTGPAFRVVTFLTRVARIHLIREVLIEHPEVGVRPCRFRLVIHVGRVEAGRIAGKLPLRREPDVA